MQTSPLFVNECTHAYIIIVLQHIYMHVINIYIYIHVIFSLFLLCRPVRFELTLSDLHVLGKVGLGSIDTPVMMQPSQSVKFQVLNGINLEPSRTCLESKHVGAGVCFVRSFDFQKPTASEAACIFLDTKKQKFKVSLANLAAMDVHNCEAFNKVHQFLFLDQDRHVKGQIRTYESSFLHLSPPPAAFAHTGFSSSVRFAIH